MTKSTETQIAVLKTQTETLHADLGEMKNDIKTIKELLSSKFVTKEEFTNFRLQAERNLATVKRMGITRAVITGVVTAIIVTIVTYEITRQLKGQ